MKVLGIAGSARRGGNTDMLLAELMRGAEGKGAEVKTIVLCNLNFTTCVHCDACLKKGICKYQDDMQAIYLDFEQADVIVLASPIQFTGVTSNMKAMIDRFQSRWVRKYILKIPPLGDTRVRKGFFISVAGRKVPDVFQPALIMIKTFFRILNISYAGDLLVSSVDEKGAIAKHPDVLQQAFLAGEKLVEPG